MAKLIETSSLSGWRLAKKVQPIRAKPLISILVDRSVLSKFLVDTLEGHEVLGDGALVCVGGAGDAWQQMPSKMLAKYDVTDVDNDGWMVCAPKPENSISVFEVTKEMADENGKFYILGQFGQQAEDGLRQYGEVGDMIGQNRTDPSDVWRISRKIFLNTYQFMS